MLCWFTKNGTVANMTKGTCNRGRLGEHARMVLKYTRVEKKCLICGYDLHVDVCHKKDVQDFLDTDLVKDINNPDNLVYMCKNHHWEFDNDYISLNLEY